MLRSFRRRFWLPPRAHGEVIEDRSVSFLELFYDLVYVVVIARAAHTLAEDITWRSVGEFAAVFGLIWFAWLNGTAYHDLHGREDGRTRTYVFAQMLLLALLAVFTAHAADEDGTEFALVFTLFLLLLTWLWWTVRRQDAEVYGPLTARYLSGMAISIVVMVVSAFLPDGPRVVLWGVFVLAWAIGAFWIEGATDDAIGFNATEALVERFGLFTIIVLGEVVVGVVTGISEVEANAEVIATGLVGLMIGFGLWWTYFDYVSQRLPRPDGTVTTQWALGHMPVTMAIAAAGAAMVSLVEHANDDRALAGAAWLLAGSVAVGLLGLIAIMRSLRDYERLPSLYQPLTAGAVVAAGLVLLAGWWRPTPWLLVLVVVAILSGLWGLAVDRWLRMDDPSAIRPNG